MVHGSIGTDLIRPHGEEARARRGGFETRPYKKARAVANHEGGPSFEARPPRPEERSSSALTRVFDALRSASRRAAAAPQDEATSSFETHRTVGKCRLCDAPQDEVGTGSRCGASVRAAIAFTLAEAAH